MAFESVASNLASDDSNGVGGVFVRDRQLGTTQRVSVASGGAEGNDGSCWASISADGRVVAFTSESDNLVSGDTNEDSDVFVRERCAVSAAAAFAGDDVNADVIAPGDPGRRLLARGPLVRRAVRGARRRLRRLLAGARRRRRLRLTRLEAATRRAAS